MQKMILVICLIVLTACAQKPVTDYDQSRDFMSLHRYAWTDAPLPAGVDPLINNTLNNQRVRQAVDDVLTGEGLQKVDASQADFLITYHLVTRDKINSNPSGFGFGMFGGMGGLGLGGAVTITQYEETELFLDMLDPKSSALIWRGSVKYTTSASSTPDARMEDMRQKVQLILSAYPPH